MSEFRTFAARWISDVTHIAEVHGDGSHEPALCESQVADHPGPGNEGLPVMASCDRCRREYQRILTSGGR